MAELGTMKSGSHIAFILCILFLESRLPLIKAIDIPPKRLCSEDVLVLLQHLSSSPCKVTNETDIILDYRVQDVRNCLVSCNIGVSIRNTSNTTSRCQPTNVSKVSDSIETTGQLKLSKEFSCCDNPRRNVSIHGYCDYTAYNRDSLELGERCILKDQCKDSRFPLTCLESRCSCTDWYIEYKGQCLKESLTHGDRCVLHEQCVYPRGYCNEICSCDYDYTYSKETKSCIREFVSYGDKCVVNKQCSNHGGYCNRTCSCAYNYEYNWKNNSCIRAWNLQVGDACTSDSQCGGTENSMNCSSRRCACKTGYFQLHRICHKESLSHGDPCVLHEQCVYARGYCKGTCSCAYDYTYSDKTKSCIRAWNLQVGDECTSDRQCGGTENSMNCSSRRCACKAGYIQSHRMCLEDGLHIGSECLISRQCSGSQFPLICDTSEHCVCSPGYIYDGSTYTCIKDSKQTGGPEMQQSESDQDTVVVGAAVGSLVIGVIIGVMTTLGAMFLLKRSRAKKDCDTEKPPVGRHEVHVYEEKLQTRSKQDTYEQIGSMEEKNNTIKDVELNSENVYHVVEPTPSAPIEDKVNKQEEESVYNHLFEKVEESETSTYDNPHEICAGRYNQAFVEEGKVQNASHDDQASIEERISRDTSLPAENKLAGFNRGSPNVTNDNSESDDYFVLECNK